MANNPVPSLSGKGWIRDAKPKADKLMAYYLTSNFSQTNLFRGEVVSLPKQVQEFNSDPTALRDLIQDDLRRMLGRYFDQVTVEVTTDRPNKEDPARLNITLSVFVTQEGQTYSLGRLIETADGQVSQIMAINNKGSI